MAHAILLRNEKTPTSQCHSCFAGSVSRVSSCALTPSSSGGWRQQQRGRTGEAERSQTSAARAARSGFPHGQATGVDRDQQRRGSHSRKQRGGGDRRRARAGGNPTSNGIRCSTNPSTFAPDATNDGTDGRLGAVGRLTICANWRSPTRCLTGKAKS